MMVEAATRVRGIAAIMPMNPRAMALSTGEELVVSKHFYASEPVVVGITDKRREGVVEIGHSYPSLLLSDN